MLNRRVSRLSTSRFPLASTRPSNDTITKTRICNKLPAHRYLHAVSPKTSSVDVASRNLSPNSSSTSDPPPEPDNQNPIPDQEWEIRTGRAIFVLQETLPEFFKTGLITSVDKLTGAPQPARSIIPTANVNFLEPHIIHDDAEAIYSPNVRLSYTPPVALPPPFPKTFHIEGFQLYLASSSFIRHTMMALYSDLTVENIKLVLDTLPADTSSTSKKRRISREKRVILRQNVAGTARVTGKPGEWTIESTYTFSPITGLIHEHIINSIHPAPHEAVYDSIRLGLGKILGLGGTGPGAANGTAFKGKRV
ncbi:hypothetical protein D9613_010446 [Agrocybe pediades]|uniref:Uncharacterized protein n=1 Tax=Agrocybe pediades TaxID=84607 RepID=A0A8H4QFM0_9AGAR|nr:hypothetical protein D9613_010446 [Agrocybe pediades]